MRVRRERRQRSGMMMRVLRELKSEVLQGLVS
jgi:hypothetical protein